MKKASDIMSTDVFFVSPEKTLNFVDIMSELRHIRHVPVVDQREQLVGIVSVRAILAHLTEGASQFAPINDIMTRFVVTSSEDASLKEIADLMRKNEVSCVPILRDGKVVGIVSDRDFLKLVDNNE